MLVGGAGTERAASRSLPASSARCPARLAPRRLAQPPHKRPVAPPSQSAALGRPGYRQQRPSPGLRSTASACTGGGGDVGSGGSGGGGGSPGGGGGSDDQGSNSDRLAVLAGLLMGGFAMLTKGLILWCTDPAIGARVAALLDAVRPSGYTAFRAATLRSRGGGGRHRGRRPRQVISNLTAPTVICPIRGTSHSWDPFQQHCCSSTRHGQRLQAWWVARQALLLLINPARVCWGCLNLSSDSHSANASHLISMPFRWSEELPSCI